MRFAEAKRRRFLIVVWVVASVGCDRFGKTPKTEHDRLIAETTRRAAAVADGAIAAFLPTPAGGSTGGAKAQAKVRFSNRRLVEQKDNFALVATTAETTDMSGGTGRQDWCTIVKFEPPRGETVVWSAQEGAWNCSAGMNATAVLLQKAMIGWPGASDEAQATTAGPKPAP